MSSMSVSPYAAARTGQAEDRAGIKQAGEAAKTKIAVVGAQVGVAEVAGKEGLGLKDTKDYAGVRIETVGGKAIADTKCAAAKGIFSSIKAMEPATSPESPLVAGAYATLDVGVKTIAAVVAAKTAVAERAAALPVNLTCAPEKPAPAKAEK